MTLTVRAAVENAAGHVFPVRLTYVRGWYMLGDAIKRDEPDIDALRRALVEEGSIKLNGTPQLVCGYSNQPVLRNDHVLLYQIAHGAWDETEAISFGEIAQTAWAGPMHLPKDATPATRQQLAEIYGDARVGPFWTARNR